MRTSSLGKHASLEGKLYSQEENVAETDRVNPYDESEIPIFMTPPTIAKRWGDLLRRTCVYSLAPQLTLTSVSRQLWESMKSLQFHGLVSSSAIRVKVSEGDLSRWINCYLSNEGTGCNSLCGRRTGRQCCNQGSESVVVVGVHVRRIGRTWTPLPLWRRHPYAPIRRIRGVTTYQGDGSTVHRAKGLRPDSFITHRYGGIYSLGMEVTPRC
jgi:hypothetical protein